MSFMLNIDFNYLLDSSKELSLVFMALFFGILFLQSGLDKVFNFNDNLNFLKNHFQKTLFKSQVNLLFITLIILEIVTGMIFIVSLFGVCLYGFSELLTALLFLGVIMSNITLANTIEITIMIAEKGTDMIIRS